MRIGIRCYYHVTLEPTDGIGVFAHNLARGLADQPSPVEVVIMTRPGEEHLVQSTVDYGGGKIAAASPPKLSRIRRRLRRVAQKIQRKSLHWSASLAARGASRGSVSAGATKGSGASLFERWLKGIAQRCQAVVERVNRQEEASIEGIVSGCDLWLIPYIGLERKFSTPTVVMIHDLVCYHYPETMRPATLEAFKELAPRVAHQSTVAACMSRFIRDNDLFGVLHLDPSRVRVVAPATPTDFGVMAQEQQASELTKILSQKYIFYPAAFRAYKNHELLIAALDQLDRSGRNDIHLVFTGIHETPPLLQERLQCSSVADRVHVLGKVERPELALLYHRAAGTVVPSLYEQGSFPLMEAMHWNCPIAASDIPSFREFFEPMGDSMIYFSPHDARELAGVLERLVDGRQEILARQQSAYRPILARTWADAAKEWLDVFRYTVDLHQPSQEDSNESRSIRDLTDGIGPRSMSLTRVASSVNKAA